MLNYSLIRRNSRLRFDCDLEERQVSAQRAREVFAREVFAREVCAQEACTRVARARVAR